MSANAFDLATLDRPPLVAVPAAEDLSPEPQDDEVAALLAKMLTSAQLDLLPPPRPLIRGILDLESASWLIGKPGSYKSFLAIDWAGHVALGMDWHGCRIHQGKVVYLVAEGSRGIVKRKKAFEAKYGSLGDRVLFLPVPIQVHDEHTRFTGRPGREWRTLIKACQQVEPVLVVLDTQARITTGLEENSAKETGFLVKAVDELKAATRACILVVHHIGRNGQDARGSSAIDAAQDTEVRIDKQKNLRAVISLDKQKEGPDDGTWHLELCPVAVGVDDEGEEINSLYIKPDAPTNAGADDDEDGLRWVGEEASAEKLFIRILRTYAPEDGFTVLQVVSTSKDLADKRAAEGKARGAELSKATGFRIAKDLTKAGRVEKVGAKYVIAAGVTGEYRPQDSALVSS